MTTRSFRWRLTGLALVAAAVGSSLLHRSVHAAATGGAATAAEMALGLLSFGLASAGILLMIHGPRLIEGRHQTRAGGLRDPIRDIGPGEQRRAAELGSPYDDDIDRASFGADRFAVATGLVRSALAHGHPTGNADRRAWRSGRR